MPKDVFQISGSKSLKISQDDSLEPLKRNIELTLDDTSNADSTQLDKDLSRAGTIVVDGKILAQPADTEVLKKQYKVLEALNMVREYIMSEEQQIMTEQEKEGLREKGSWDFKRSKTEKEENAFKIIAEQYPQQMVLMKALEDEIRESMEVIQLSKELLEDPDTESTEEEKRKWRESLKKYGDKIFLAKENLQSLCNGKPLESEIERLEGLREQAINTFKAVQDNERTFIPSKLNSLHQGVTNAALMVLRNNYTFQNVKLGLITFEPVLEYERQQSSISNSLEFTYRLQGEIYGFMDEEGVQWGVNKEGTFEKVVDYRGNSITLPAAELKQEGYLPLFTIAATTGLDFKNIKEPVASFELVVNSIQPGLKYNGPVVDPAIKELGNIGLIDKIKRAFGLLVNKISNAFGKSKEENIAEIKIGEPTDLRHVASGAPNRVNPELLKQHSAAHEELTAIAGQKETEKKHSNPELSKHVTFSNVTEPGTTEANEKENEEKSDLDKNPNPKDL